jgi:hypothetical protein
MKRLLIVALISTLMLSLSCSYMGYALRQQGYDGLKRPWIRVRILQGSENVKIDAKGSFVVRTWDTNNEKSAYYSATPVVVKAVRGELNLLDHDGYVLEQRLLKVTIIANHKKQLRLNGRVFRGIFEFHPLKSDSFYTVNVLNIEDYLQGVLQPEIGNRTEDEFEAVKAQAVAARTYAFTTKDKYPDREYDLINDIGDQVYTGVAGEQEITNRAAKATRGEILMYENDLMPIIIRPVAGALTISRTSGTKGHVLIWSALRTAAIVNGRNSLTGTSNIRQPSFSIMSATTLRPPTAMPARSAISCSKQLRRTVLPADALTAFNSPRNVAAWFCAKIRFAGHSVATTNRELCPQPISKSPLIVTQTVSCGRQRLSVVVTGMALVCASAALSEWPVSATTISRF